jgi:hypothetical protein
MAINDCLAVADIVVDIPWRVPTARPSWTALPVGNDLVPATGFETTSAWSIKSSLFLLATMLRLCRVEKRDGEMGDGWVVMSY